MSKAKPISISFLSDALDGLDPRPIGEYNYSAVLLPLIEKNDGLHLLYQVRAETLRNQPGEISFPGGKLEPGEIPLECAVRETHEELGVPIDKINVISELNYINSFSNFSMYSFLGQIDEKVLNESEINKDEVKELFTVPLEFFIENQPDVHTYVLKPEIGDDFPYAEYGIEENYPWRKGTATVPFYEYINGNEKRVIWGLTARLTQDFVRLIKEKL